MRRAHAQVVDPRLDPRRELVVAVAPDRTGDPLHAWSAGSSAAKSVSSSTHASVSTSSNGERRAIAGSLRPIVPSAESIQSSWVSAKACTSRRVSPRSEELKTIVS